MPGITPSQTVGPYFAFGLDPRGQFDWVQTFSNDLTTPDASGKRIRIEGRVFDGDGAPINDCMIEIWQADAAGRYAHPADQRRPNAKFTGFGRVGTDANGAYSFTTIKPGAVPGGVDSKMQAPHILVAIFARGMQRHCYTRIYFPDEAANAADPILNLVPADRRSTLVAELEEKNGQSVYAFDIHIQVQDETVFFDV